MSQNQPDMGPNHRTLSNAAASAAVAAINNEPKLVHARVPLGPNNSVQITFMQRPTMVEWGRFCQHINLMGPGLITDAPPAAEVVKDATEKQEVKRPRPMPPAPIAPADAVSDPDNGEG